MGMHEENGSGRHTLGPPGDTCPECCRLLQEGGDNIIPVVVNFIPTGKFIQTKD